MRGAVLSLAMALLAGCDGGYGCGTSDDYCAVAEPDLGLCECGHRPIRADEVASLPASPESISAMFPLELRTDEIYCDPDRGPLDVQVTLTLDGTDPGRIQLPECGYDADQVVVYRMETSGRLGIEGPDLSWSVRLPEVLIHAYVFPPGAGGSVSVFFTGQVSKAELNAQADGGVLGALLDGVRQEERWDAEDSELVAIVDGYTAHTDIQANVLSAVSLIPYHIYPAEPIGCYDPNRFGWPYGWLSAGWEAYPYACEAGDI